jgi:hypothetical protein
MTTKWLFTVNPDGVYHSCTYEGHSHPFPDETLLACAKFCATDGKIETIVQELSDWEFFTDDVELQKEINAITSEYLIKNAFYREHLYPEEEFYPKNRRQIFGEERYLYGAIHIWKQDDPRRA